MTSKTKGLLVLLSAVVLPVGLFTVAVSHSVSIEAAENHDYVINLTSANQISESGDHNVKTILGNDVAFYYSEVASPSAGDHVHLNKNGHIYNSDHILSIKSISAVFTGTLQFATGLNVGSFGDYTTMTSGTKYTLETSPYYFDLFANNAECHLTSATIEFFCSTNPDAEKITYQKVTSNSQLTSGNYIVVYENSEIAFDATSDSSSNYINVEIANEKFDYSSSLANAVLRFDANDGSLKNANDQYLYHEGNSNNISFGDDPVENEISISGGDAEIYCGSYLIKYNSNSGQTRFRYYSSTSTQKAVQLYKASNSSPIYAKSISLTADSTSLYLGGTMQVNVTYNPEGTTVKNVTWKSSNETVATVDGTGLVSALAVGSATITAIVPTAYGTTSNTIEFTVSKKNVTGLTLNKDKTTLQVGGESETLVASIAPADASVKTVYWSSSKTSVATVVNGVVTPVSEGQATITATSADNPNVSATCLVTVEKVVAPTVSTCQFTDKDWNSTGDVSWDKGQAGAGYSNSGVQVTSAASGANATTKTSFNNVKKVIVTYCTNASKGAGNIAITIGTTSYGSQSVTSTGGTTGRTMEFNKTPVASGKVKIEVTCTTNSIYIIGVRIECVSEPTDPTDLSIQSELELVAGGSKKLDVTYTPANANKNLDVTWESSDTSVATVENGVVTVKNSASVGQTATITATLDRDTTKKSQCVVTVVEEQKDDFTILEYICGADLESKYGQATEDIQEMLSVNGQPDDVNIVIQTGGAKSWKSDLGIDSSRLGRHHIDNKQLVNDEYIDYSSMGVSSTLRDFIEWGINNYPAKKYGLIMWNHGGAMMGCCQDEKKNDILEPKELNDAVKNALKDLKMEGEKLEFIGYDCCLMQVQDIADLNSDYFNYMVASQETENGTGWNYDEWLPDLYAGKSTTKVLQKICDTFIADNEFDIYGDPSSTASDQTLSVLDLSKMDAYKTAFEDLAGKLGSVVSSYGKNNFMKLMKYVQSYGNGHFTQEEITAYEQSGEDMSDYSYDDTIGYYVDLYNGIEAYGTFDVIDFLDTIGNNSSFDSIDEEIATVKAVAKQLIIYNKAGYRAGNSNGLCLCYSYDSYTDNFYTSDQTRFTNWFSFNTTYGA